MGELAVCYSTASKLVFVYIVKFCRELAVCATATNGVSVLCATATNGVSVLCATVANGVLVYEKRKVFNRR